MMKISLSFLIEVQLYIDKKNFIERYMMFIIMMTIECMYNSLHIIFVIT